MLSVGHSLHQPVLPVASVEDEGLPDQDGGRHDTRTDAHPLVDASEIEDHEEDEDCKQPALRKIQAPNHEAAVFEVSGSPDENLP